MRCYVMYYSLLQQKWKVAPVSISLGDAAMAREAIRRVFRDGVKDGEKHEGQRERECLRLVGFVREREKKIKGIGIEAS